MMKNIRAAISRMRYKRTAVYVLVVAALMVAVGAADAHAAQRGKVSFRVGSAPVERTVDPGTDGDSYMMIHLFVNGKELAPDEERGCSVYFHDEWVTVRVRSCPKDETVTLKAINFGRTKRVTFKWEDQGPVHPKREI